MNATPKKRDSDPLVTLEAAIEGISYNLSQIEDMDGLSVLKGPRLIDLTARLNAQHSALEKFLEPLKQGIKQESLKSGQPLIKGNLYQALVSKTEKIVLDTEKVKEFLGRKLAQFTKKQTVTSVQFQVKE